MNNNTKIIAKYLKTYADTEKQLNTQNNRTSIAI